MVSGEKADSLGWPNVVWDFRGMICAAPRRVDFFMDENIKKYSTQSAITKLLGGVAADRPTQELGQGATKKSPQWRYKLKIQNDRRLMGLGAV